MSSSVLYKLDLTHSCNIELSNMPKHDACQSALTDSATSAAAKLKVGMRVTIRRGSGGERQATIKTIHKDTGMVEVQWDEAGSVMQKTVTAAEIVALN